MRFQPFKERATVVLPEPLRERLNNHGRKAKPVKTRNRILVELIESALLKGGAR